MHYDLITTLLDFPGFQVSDIWTEDRSAFRMVFSPSRVWKEPIGAESAGK
jgi:hypothetical protein